MPSASFAQPSAFAELGFAKGVLTVRPFGPTIGEREAAILAPELKAAMSRTGADLRVLVIDLSHVRVISSMGLALLIDLRARGREVRARTILCGLSRELRALLRLTKVDRLYTIARTESDVDRLTAA